MQYQIGFGIGFEHDGTRIDPHHAAECIKLILVEASHLFGGCNITSGQGAWVDGSGTLVVEESRVLVVNSLSRQEVKAYDLAEFVRRILKQEAVTVTAIEAEANIHHGLAVR